MFTTLTDSSNIRDWSSRRRATGLSICFSSEISLIPSTSCVLSPPPPLLLFIYTMIWFDGIAIRIDSMRLWSGDQHKKWTARSRRDRLSESVFISFFFVFCEVFQSLHWSLLLEQSEDTIITTILLQWLCSACLSLERAISCAQLSCQIAVFGPVWCDTCMYGMDMNVSSTANVNVLQIGNCM